ncbi:UPF0609 protein C4orf27 like protein [Atta colombica]|uniref:UPF0609 protein C4orf27 like protein n=1 Tax=Atta colombica TaxID=520822 RepID=A0A195AVH0_9HYME|nr:UPF0609 protein C4orf27 like protein [Atta colombica]
MSSNNVKDSEFQAYKDDSRIPCKYGTKCYQKNPQHHSKYKHPPKGEKLIQLKIMQLRIHQYLRWMSKELLWIYFWLRCRKVYNTMIYTIQELYPQTIVKCDDKEGLHFGYWRDDAVEKPVFIAKNRANVNGIFEPVAENIFGAVDAYLQNKVKTVNPFEKTSIIRLHSQLKNFAKQHNITLDKNTADMRAREKRVVARTFHKAGIVVPYDKKTQLDDLQKTLKQIEEAVTPEDRKMPIAKLDEIVRLATIAADECDFGTCLELGHDLFSNGCIHVQTRALEMLFIAYTHLKRPQLLKILEAHLKNRKKDCELNYEFAASIPMERVGVTNSTFDYFNYKFE